MKFAVRYTYPRNDRYGNLRGLTFWSGWWTYGADDNLSYRRAYELGYKDASGYERRTMRELTAQRGIATHTP